MGALPINPNTPERIMKVLDKILEAARMKNIFVVKLVLCEDSVKKVFNDDPEVRKHIVVTADGLPYKMMIDVIKNHHKCANCGIKFNHISKLRKHKNETQHSEFFQSYGNI